MPILTNPRHERFAQELAKGKTATEAYINAGYDVGSDKSANEAGSRLSRHIKVLARVKELQERAAIRTEVTVAKLTEDLIRIAQRAEQLDGAPGLAVARNAVMDIAKLNGLVVERKEVGAPGQFEQMNADELREYISREAEKLGVGGRPPEGA